MKTKVKILKNAEISKTLSLRFIIKLHVVESFIHVL